MRINKSRFARAIAMAATLAFASVGAEPVYASGPGMAAKFAVLSNGVISTANATLKGDVGGFTVQLTDKGHVNGNVIGGVSFGSALLLGDDALVTGKCVTGGGDISIIPEHPAKCVGGEDTSGTNPLLTEFNKGLSDAGMLIAALKGLTPTMTLPEIDVMPHAKMTMKFPAGVNVVELNGMFPRMLIESHATLTIDAPKGSSVIFLVGTEFSATFHAKITLSGGIKANNVAYVVGTSATPGSDATIGDGSSADGTILAPAGNCTLNIMSKLTGALICKGSVNFQEATMHPPKLTFAPLPTKFP